MVGPRSNGGLAPGVQTSIKAVVMMDFRTQRLIVPDEFGDAEIHAINVARAPQMVGGGAMPASVFASAFSPSLAIDVAHIGDEIELVVSRPNGGEFRAMLFGSVYEAPLPPLVKAAKQALGLLPEDK